MSTVAAPERAEPIEASTCGNCGGPMIPIQGGGGMVCAKGC